MIFNLSALQQNKLNNIATHVEAAVPALLFGLRFASAVSLALYIAFFIQLDNPSWAGTSAAIVSQPVLGSSMRKGVYRLIGTAIGAIATVVLTALFPQDRFGFLLVLALWCALCAFISTLLKNFAAYAAQLAGYTLVIIASSSIAEPDQVFLLALSRATEISLGIVCSMVIMSLTDLGSSRQRLAQATAVLVTEFASGFKHQLESAATRTDLFRSIRRSLLARIIELDPLIDQTVGELPSLNMRRSILQAGIDGLIISVAAWRTIEDSFLHLSSETARAEAQALLSRFPELSLDLRSNLIDHLASPQDTIAPRRDHSILSAQTLRSWEVEKPSMRLLADRTATVVEGLGKALNNIVLLGALQRGLPYKPGRRVLVPDLLPPLVNGGRVFLALGAGIFFYIVTSWPSGLTFLTFLAITVLLMAPRHEAAPAAAIGFAGGTLLAAVLAAIAKFAILPNHETYTSFAFVIGAFLLPLAALSTYARFSGFFVPAASNVIPILGPTNVISYDTLSFYNNALAILAGCVAGAVILMVIPQIPARIRTRRLVALSLAQLRQLCRDPPPQWSLQRWRSQIFGKLLGLPPGYEHIEGTRILAALTVGHQILAIQTAAALEKADPVLAHSFQNALSLGELDRCQELLQRLTASIEGVPTTVCDPVEKLRLQGALNEMSALLRDHADFFGAVIT